MEEDIKSFRFTPRFKKFAFADGERKWVEASPKQVSDALLEIRNHSDLMEKIREYVTRFRLTDVSLHDEEISFNKTIFPPMQEIIWRHQLSLFSGDIAEKLFNEIEEEFEELQKF